MYKEVFNNYNNHENKIVVSEVSYYLVNYVHARTGYLVS